MKEHRRSGMYGRLLVMSCVSFIAMYGLMYAMVDSLPNVFNNFNQVYMAGLMAGAMLLIELGVMRSMYPDKRRNLAIPGVGALILIGSWTAIRTQFAIGDRQFIRSMIPHHAGGYSDV